MFTDVVGLRNQELISSHQQTVNRALIDHCQSNTLTSDGDERFSQLLMCLPEIQLISLEVESYLYRQYGARNISPSSILEEMLHSKP